MQIPLIAVAVAICGLLLAAGLYVFILRSPTGLDRMREIGEQIHLGAMTYLRAQYLKIAIFVAVVGLLLSFQYDLRVTGAFVLGACASALAGFVGMKAATRANVRTTAAAMTKGESGALLIAFNGGAVTGLLVVALVLLAPYRMLRGLIGARVQAAGYPN